jgi:acetylornithine deacetylase/succinyl-diaminopimelate desuccinylase-like protein
MARLGEVLRRLDRRHLPVHVTPIADAMLSTLAGALPFPQGGLMRLLAHPRLTWGVLRLLGSHGRQLDPLLHHTVSPTVVRGGDAVNVIPSTVTLDLDGRLLPGYGPDDIVGELGRLLGHPDHGAPVEIEVLSFEPGPAPADMARFETLAAALRDHDPTGVPFPHLLSGVTDARHFARLGIQSYGFVPMNVGDEQLVDTIHGADERVPVSAIDFGLRVMVDVLARFRG